MELAMTRLCTHCFLARDPISMFVCRQVYVTKQLGELIGTCLLEEGLQ